jgi:Mobilization protein NikA
MNEAAAEPAPAREAPAVIHLPPPPDIAAPPKARHGSGKRRRTHLEQFRTDDDEHAELERRARDAGLSVSAYNRQCTIGEDTAPPRRRPRRIATAEAEALMTALVAFNRANNNLNQLARSANTLALFAEEHRHRLADLTGDLVQAVEDLREDFAPSLAAIRAAIGHDPEG